MTLPHPLEAIRRAPSAWATAPLQTKRAPGSVGGALFSLQEGPGPSPLGFSSSVSYPVWITLNLFFLLGLCFSSSLNPCYFQKAFKNKFTDAASP